MIFINGDFVADGDAMVSVLDRGYLLGDAIFETVRVYDGICFATQRHLERLFYGMEVTGLRTCYSRTDIAALLNETVQRSGLKEAVSRLTLSRGSVEGIGPRDQEGTFSISVRPLRRYPEHCYREGIATRTLRRPRIPPSVLDPGFKSACYLPAILARRELDREGIIEGIQLSVDGELVSGLVSNLFLSLDEELCTPRLESGCLPGVTRAVILSLARGLGIRAVERRLTPADLESAHEMFFTNTLMECLPVSAVNGRRVAEVPGTVTRALSAALARYIAESNEKEAA